MTKHVLDVGNCVPDHAAMRRLIEGKYHASLSQTHGLDDTLAILRRGGIDLVLVNRKLDQDYSDGLEIIKQIKSDPDLAAIPCMLITNYAEHQELAQQAGAELGFGKLELELPETHAKLGAWLG